MFYIFVNITCPKQMKTNLCDNTKLIFAEFRTISPILLIWPHSRAEARRQTGCGKHKQRA